MGRLAVIEIKLVGWWVGKCKEDAQRNGCTTPGRGAVSAECCSGLLKVELCSLPYYFKA